MKKQELDLSAVEQVTESELAAVLGGARSPFALAEMPVVAGFDFDVVATRLENLDLSGLGGSIVGRLSDRVGS